MFHILYLQYLKSKMVKSNSGKHYIGAACWVTLQSMMSCIS